MFVLVDEVENVGQSCLYDLVVLMLYQLFPAHHTAVMLQRPPFQTRQLI